MSQKVKKPVAKFITGLGMAVILSLLSVLLLAFIVKKTGLGGRAVGLITSFVKVFAVFTGCVFGLSGKKKGLKGALMGVSVTLATYLLFSAISGDFSVNLKTAIDSALSAVAGLIGGAILNVKGKEE